MMVLCLTEAPCQPCPPSQDRTTGCKWAAEQSMTYFWGWDHLSISALLSFLKVSHAEGDTIQHTFAIQHISLGFTHSAAPKLHISLTFPPSHDISQQTTSVNRLQDPHVWLQCQPETQSSLGNEAETHLGYYSGLNPSAHFDFTIPSFSQMLFFSSAAACNPHLHKIHAKPVNP